MEKQYVVVHESAVHSILSDLSTFSILFIFLYLNYHYIGNDWIIRLFAFIILYCIAIARSRKYYHIFDTKEEAIQFLEDFKF